VYVSLVEYVIRHNLLNTAMGVVSDSFSPPITLLHKWMTAYGHAGIASQLLLGGSVPGLTYALIVSKGGRSTSRRKNWRVFHTEMLDIGHASTEEVAHSAETTMNTAENNMRQRRESSATKSWQSRGRNVKPRCVCLRNDLKASKKAVKRKGG